MKAKPITYGQLAELLTELGFTHKVYDEHRVVYTDKATDSFFVLPNGPADAVAREIHVAHVRYQLHWRGLMEQEDFDARFASSTAATS